VANGAELRAEETSSAKNQKTERERQRTSQVASSGRRYFRVTVIVLVNDLSNKQLRLIRNPLISCRVTRIRDNIEREEENYDNYYCQSKGKFQISEAVKDIAGSK
jgi:hypothetical protein